MFSVYLLGIDLFRFLFYSSPEYLDCPLRPALTLHSTYGLQLTDNQKKLWS